MEPADLNQSSGDAPLENLLRQPLPPLPGDAFAARVMRALPPPARIRIFTTRRVMCLAAGAAGLAVAWSKGASWSALAESGEQLSASVARTLGSVADGPSLVLAAVVIVISLAVSTRMAARALR